VLTLSSDGGSGDAQAEAEDGSPSSTSTASFGPSAITAGADNPLASAFAISVSSISTTSLAKGKGTNVSSKATSSKVTIAVTVDFTLLETIDGESGLCATLTTLNADVGEACTKAAAGESGDEVPYASIEVSPNNAACTWDGETFDATGQGSSITPTILGTALPAIAPGQPPQTIGADTPVAMQLVAGGFGKEERDDGVDGIGGAAAISLFGGQALIRLSASSCSVGAALPGDEVKALAVTGSVVLWYLLGGAVMVAGALGLRRFLHRPA
jgi:hypothetical protein